MIEIKDNFLSPEECLNIKSILMERDFPWFYNNTITDNNDLSNFQFTHLFYGPNVGKASQWYDLFFPFFSKMTENGLIIRIKANLNVRTETNNQLGDYHIDYPWEGKTAIYYLNTNNGFTLFETGEKVDSIENRLVVFDSNIKHVGYSCNDEKIRVVLNCNYIL